MFIAHLIIGLAGGLLAAAWVWLGVETSLWLAVGTYVVAGNATCLISAGIALYWQGPAESVETGRAGRANLDARDVPKPNSRSAPAR